MDGVLEQSIFICENEMSHMEGTRVFILCKSTTIVFGEEDSTKSIAGTVQDDLNDVMQNENTCRDSLMYLPGIFSYQKRAPIENWMQNSVENLAGNK